MLTGHPLAFVPSRTQGAEEAWQASDLPPELRLRALSFLPPNELALSGRLSSKDAAQRFSEPHHRTARLRQRLSGHAVTATTTRVVEVDGEVVEGDMAAAVVQHAARAAKQLNFRHKLCLALTAAASGYEANVEFALQLLQPNVFPELLHTDFYMDALPEGRCYWQDAGFPLSPIMDLGSAAVTSGLAHLLPSLVQRCPGLLDPCATLGAAARHCDLAGLQAAWEAVGQQLLTSFALPQRNGFAACVPTPMEQRNGVRSTWWRVMAAAASSSTHDAIAKMGWVF